jgi:quercetin dioxygenase-like cupin family protein
MPATDIVNWNSLEERTIIPGFHGKFVHSEKMTIVRWRVEAGASLPEHHHPHEQIGLCLAGRLAVFINGGTTVMEAGDVLVIPSGTRHGAEALAETLLIDVFTPVREDYRGDFTRTLLGDLVGGSA